MTLFVVLLSLLFAPVQPADDGNTPSIIQQGSGSGN
jgi:hypothetical protein